MLDKLVKKFKKSERIIDNMDDDYVHVFYKIQILIIEPENRRRENARKGIFQLKDYR